jgi:hypothetical protein
MLVYDDASLSYLSPPTTVNGNKGEDGHTDVGARSHLDLASVSSMAIHILMRFELVRVIPSIPNLRLSKTNDQTRHYYQAKSPLTLFICTSFASFCFCYFICTANNPTAAVTAYVYFANVVRRARFTSARLGGIYVEGDGGGDRIRGRRDALVLRSSVDSNRLGYMTFNSVQ